MIKEGDFVLLKGKLCKASGAVDIGKIISADKIIGKEYGDEVEGVAIGCPRLDDFKARFRRGPQIMTEKDIGFIFAKTGLGKKDVVVEGGTGSGFLTCALAKVCKHVHSYDIERTSIRLGKRNSTFSGLENITFHNSSLYEEAEEADIYMLDLPEPWRVPLNNLKAGGFLVSYLPTIDQVQTLLENSKLRFEVVELIQRNWQAKRGRFRPESSGLLHTGFLCFARKR